MGPERCPRSLGFDQGKLNPPETTTFQPNYEGVQKNLYGTTIKSIQEDWRQFGPEEEDAQFKARL